MHKTPFTYKSIPSPGGIPAGNEIADSSALRYVPSLRSHRVSTVNVGLPSIVTAKKLPPPLPFGTRQIISSIPSYVENSQA